MNWNWNSYKAAGKHVASYAAGGVTVAVAFGLLNSSQGTEATTDINTIATSLESLGKAIAGLAGILVPIYTAWRAANNASPAGQAAGLAAAVPETRIITTPEVANAVPSDKVMSNEDVKVVTK